MARQDIAGLLTGISSTQQPVQQAVPGSPNFYGEFMAARGRGLQQGLGGLMRGGAPSTQERIQGSMFELGSPTAGGVAKDTTTLIADLTKLARVQQMQGNPAAAAQTAAQVQQLKGQVLATEQADKVSDQLPPEFNKLGVAVEAQVPGAMEKAIDILGSLETSDMKVKYLVNPVTQTTVANVYQKGTKLYDSKMNVIELGKDSFGKGLILSDTFVKPPSSLVSTSPSAEAIRAELKSEMTLANFKDMSADLIARGKITKESYGKFMPIYQKLEELEQSGVVGEGGAGSEFFAEANNYLTTALQILDPNYIVPAEKSGVLQYEAQAKALKAKMTEMTKGAISDRENAEHNKYTVSVNMPKAVRQGKINMDKATLESAMNKVSAEEQWFEKYNTTVGFNSAWRRYTEDFPRTSGATLRNVTVDGQTVKKLVDNFEMVDDNMRLFDRLYLGKKTSGSPVFTDGEKTVSLKQVKDSLRQQKLEELMSASSVSKPTKIMEEDADRFVRKNIGFAIISKLDVGGWRVSK